MLLRVKFMVHIFRKAAREKKSKWRILTSKCRGGGGKKKCLYLIYDSEDI